MLVAAGVTALVGGGLSFVIMMAGRPATCWRSLIWPEAQNGGFDGRMFDARDDEAIVFEAVA